MIKASGKLSLIKAPGELSMIEAPCDVKTFTNIHVKSRFVTKLTKNS